MQHPICSLLLAGAASVLVLAPALAQTPAPAPAKAPILEPGTNPTSNLPEQAIQRITVEDAGSRIDEVRVGGETQSITVQPKVNMPAYEVLPSEASKGGGGGSGPSQSGAGAAGKRVWNVLKF